MLRASVSFFSTSTDSNKFLVCLLTFSIVGTVSSVLLRVSAESLGQKLSYQGRSSGR